MRKILFVGAHPDDIEFGAGATLAKLNREDYSCEALILSRCSEQLLQQGLPADTLINESSLALQELGLNSNVTFLDFPVRNFVKFRQEILQVFIDLSRSRFYTKVYIPCSFDIHQDHSVVSIEAIRAFKFTTVLGYELPWNNLQGSLRHYNALDESLVSMKKKAISSFFSQSHRQYSDEEAVESILRFHGLESGVTYAEAFEVIRWIDS